MELLDSFQTGVSPHDDALKLSIGQKQRIAFIRAILLEPEVLHLDEPCSALDGNTQRLIDDKIASLIRSTALTVIMSSHREVKFSPSTNRFFILEEGRLRRDQ